MKPCGLVEMGNSPSCLALNPSRTHLYSGNETERVGDDESGTVSAFAIDPKTGDLKLVNSVRSGGKGPAHLAVHPNGKHVLVANYFGGTGNDLVLQWANTRLLSWGLNDVGQAGNDGGTQSNVPLAVATSYQGMHWHDTRCLA